MASLILLNGPPGIGKSTLSAHYADRHPGTLNLDIDTLHRLVGGWQDPEQRTHDVLRPVALAMASTHLAGGRDVIVPQFLARVDEIEAFEKVARDQQAAFVELALLDDKAEALARFDRRRDADARDPAWEEHNRQVVTAMGGPAFLAELYDRLLELVALRPSTIVVRSVVGEVAATYAAVVRALVR